MNGICAALDKMRVREKVPTQIMFLFSWDRWCMLLASVSCERSAVIGHSNIALSFCAYFQCLKSVFVHEPNIPEYSLFIRGFSLLVGTFCSFQEVASSTTFRKRMNIYSSLFDVGCLQLWANKCGINMETRLLPTPPLATYRVRSPLSE